MYWYEWFKKLTVNFSWMCPTLSHFESLKEGTQWTNQKMSADCTLWFPYLEENRMIFKYLQYLILITKGEANISFTSLQYFWIWKHCDVCRIHQIIKIWNFRRMNIDQRRKQCISNVNKSNQCCRGILYSSTSFTWSCELSQNKTSQN